MCAFLVVLREVVAHSSVISAILFFGSLIFSLFLCLYVVLFDVLSCSCFLGFRYMYESFPTTRFSVFVLSLWTACLATRSFFLHKIVFRKKE